MNHNIIGLFPQPLTKIKIDVSGIDRFFDQNVRDNARDSIANNDQSSKANSFLKLDS